MKAARTPPTILVDTREQNPWWFRSRGVVERYGSLLTTVETLYPGDYSIPGLTSVVAIERKSLDDFIGSVTRGRERFWNELQDLRKLQRKAVIIEGSREQVWAHAYRSRAIPRSIIRSASAIQYEFGIPVIWAGDRLSAEDEAAWWLMKAWDEHRALIAGTTHTRERYA